MTNSIASDDVLKRLRNVLSSQDLTADSKQTLEGLIGRLSSPVRVTLFGEKGSGKSTLRNVISGAEIVPNETELPTTELRFGQVDQIIATLGDRSTIEIAGHDFEALRSSAAVYADIHSPQNILKKISILEVVTDGSRGEIAAASKWAAQRTDIAIWVTTGFGSEEQAIWAKLPDELKDHGFLVLNKIDTLPPGDQADICDRLEGVAAQEFRGFFPTAAQHGLATLEGADESDKKAFRASGCLALNSALMRHVDLGTQADIDGALLFLSKFEAPSAKEHSDKTKGPAEKSNSKETVATEGIPDALAVEESGATERAPDEDEQRETRESALAHLRSSAETMLDDLNDPDAPSVELVLEHCAATVEELSTSLSDEDRLLDPVMQANDVIVLLQLESDASAAEDAVVALLQLKRDFEVALAA